uniref:Uncharacterized protein n=1 Tax=Arundo donax TaxID=35708 RepID=A0A0A9EQA9_ARUDO
MYLSVFILSS